MYSFLHFYISHIACNIFIRSVGWVPGFKNSNPLGTQKDRFTGFRWRVVSWGPPGNLQHFNWSLSFNSRHHRNIVDTALNSIRSIKRYFEIDCWVRIAEILVCFRINKRAKNVDICNVCNLCYNVTPYLLVKMELTFASTEKSL